MKAGKPSFIWECFNLVYLLTSPKCVACAHTSCSWIESPPPPIHGEQVEVDITFEDVEGGSAPRANKVIRLKTPLIMAGVVEVYYGTRGYGFIKSDTGQIFLHRSEMLDGKVPVQGQQVIFCVGTKEGKPRACYVKVCEHG